MNHSNTLPQLLERNRQYVVVASGVAYVVYALLTSLLNPPGAFPGAFNSPKYWVAVLYALMAVGVGLTPEFLRRIYLPSSVGFVIATLYQVSQASGRGSMPMPLTLWLCLSFMVTFFVLGSRFGAIFTGVTVLLLLTVLVVGGPLPGAVISDWTARLVFLLGTGVVSYLIVTFIENNLLQHQQDKENLRAARQDALTEVYGRGAIEEELTRAMTHSRKTNTPMSIIVTDIDHFKVVNDRYGHATGDDVLRAVAKRLRRNVGGTGGTVGRWGGEEFIVLLPGMAKPDALVMADRLRREISDLPLAGLEVTASFGVASYRGAEDTTDGLFGRADLAMYEAKRSGRNAVR